MAAALERNEVARRLVTYSQSLAKGQFKTASGINAGEPAVLQYLSAHEDGDPATPSKLAKQLDITRARMTRILDSLEKKGLVVREQDPGDKRRMMVSITDEGRERAKNEYASSIRAMDKFIETLGERDANELLRILKKGYEITYDGTVPTELTDEG